MLDWIHARWGRVLSGPGISALIWGAGILMGLLASVFHEELLTAFPIPNLKCLCIVDYSEDIVWQAVLFWLAFILFLFLIFLREMSLTRNRRREHEQVQELIETVAPREFLATFFNMYRDAHAFTALATRAYRNNNDDEKLCQNIRLVLDYALRVAERWDTSSASLAVAFEEELVYRANVMFAIKYKDIDMDALGNVVWEWGQTLYDFKDQKHMRNASEGFLFVDCELTTKVQTVGLPDDDVRPLLLIWDGSKRGGRYNLRGAPVALARRDMDYIADTSIMVKECEKAGGFTDTEKRKISDYYESESKGRSFLSIVIPESPENEDGTLPRGVVNIYRNSPGIMDSPGKATRFRQLFEPFVALLAELLVLRSSTAYLEKSATNRA